MIKKIFDVLPIVILLSAGVFLAVFFVLSIYDNISAQRHEVTTTVIDCRHKHDGKYGSYIVTFLIDGHIIQYNQDIEYRVGDVIVCKYYYSRFLRKIYVNNIQKKY